MIDLSHKYDKNLIFNRAKRARRSQSYEVPCLPTGRHHTAKIKIYYDEPSMFLKKRKLA